MRVCTFGISLSEVVGTLSSALFLHLVRARKERRFLGDGLKAGKVSSGACLGRYAFAEAEALHCGLIRSIHFDCSRLSRKHSSGTERRLIRTRKRFWSPSAWGRTADWRRSRLRALLVIPRWTRQRKTTFATPFLSSPRPQARNGSSVSNLSRDSARKRNRCKARISERPLHNLICVTK